MVHTKVLAKTVTASAVMALFVGLLHVAPASAQLSPAPQASPARPTGNVAPKAAPKAAAAKTEAAPTAAPVGESALRQRVEQLEEQLVEMQVTVGTLDSLAKGGGSSSSGVYRGSGADAAGSADSGRVAALETQVRALATQVDQLTQQLRQANARGAGGNPVVAAPPPPGVPVAVAQPDNSDPIGRLVSNGSAQGNPAAGVVPQGATQSPSLQASGASDASSKQAYEGAYGFLLQQDFASAEQAFDDFLKRYPTDPLAGNAQYWLGETFFARGQFKPAAAAFLKVSQTYTRSAKAPDSLLKLAMSLDKLGAKDAACASYADLNAKFPNAPGHVKNRADTERRRLGCA
jgi:tol-pal system protein YbgF